jgi:hypothetical protein
MTVYKIDPLADLRWTEFVQRHPKSSVFHTPSWLDALRLTYGYSPMVFTTSPPGADLTNGLLLCRVGTWFTRDRLVSLPFSDHCDPLVDNPSELKSILDNLCNNLRNKRWQYIELRPLTWSFPDSGSFRSGKKFYLHTLDLSPSLEELFRSFHKDCIQRKILRAEREHLTYEKGRSKSLLESFYRLLVITRRRQGLPPQPAKWFRHLIRSLGDRLTIHVASKNGVSIASILTLHHKQALVYKYGCSDPRFSNLGATPFLFWKAITEAKASHLSELDMGRSDCDNSGLVTFKDRWGATRSNMAYLVCPSLQSQVTTRLWQQRMVKYVVTHMPTGLLAATGKMLYKHVG